MCDPEAAAGRLHDPDTAIGRVHDTGTAALPVLSFPRHSRGEAHARAEVAASFAARPVFAIRDRHYRLTLEGVGEAAVGSRLPVAGMPAGRVRLDDERIDVMIPEALAWRWLNDLAGRAPETDAPIGSTGAGVIAIAGTLPLPLARVLLDAVGRFFTRRTGRALRDLPGAPPRLAWCGVAVDAPAGAAAHAATAPTCVSIRVTARAWPAWPAQPSGAAQEPALHEAPDALPDQDVRFGSIILTSPSGTAGAYRLARLLAAVCPVPPTDAAPSDATPIASTHARRIRFPCPISDASLVLGLTALRRLRCGDVLLPDAPIAAAGMHAALLLPTGQRLRLDAARNKAQDEMQNEAENEAENEARRAAAACAANEYPASEPAFRIDIAATCVLLGANAIARHPVRSAGYYRERSVPLCDGPASTVQLLVQGHAIGRGEWLDIGGRRGVRILAWRARDLADLECGPASRAPGYDARRAAPSTP
ncbi:MAG: hypothetical protein ACRYHA_34585 [Janthinobacterium lividum]